MGNLDEGNEKRIRASVYDHSTAVLVKPRNGAKKRKCTQYSFHGLKWLHRDQKVTKTIPKLPQRTRLKTNWKENDQKKTKDARLFVYLPSPYRVICLHNINLHDPVNEIAVKIAGLLMIDDTLLNLYTVNNFKLERLLSFRDQGVADEGNIFVKLTEGLNGGADRPEEGFDSQQFGAKDGERDGKVDETQILRKGRNETGLSRVVLSDDDIHSLSSKVGINWYGLGLELNMEETILDDISEETTIPAKQCRRLLQNWRESCQKGINQYEVLQRALERMDGGEKAIDFLKKYNSRTLVDVQNSRVPACQDEIGEDYCLQGTSAIGSITTGPEDRIHIADSARVGNIATNITANNFIQQAEIKLPTEEERRRNMKHEVDLLKQPLGDVIQEALREKYKYGNFMRITPHQWASPRKIDLEQLFTNMTMLQNPSDGNESNAKPITIEEIANPYKRTAKSKMNAIQPTAGSDKKETEYKYSRRVLIQGKLGHGKTSLLKKIAHLWATNHKESPFTDYLVVYIELRQMNKQENTDFIDHVIHHSFPSDFVEKHNITIEILRNYIITNDKKFVFLCDGYDELMSDSESQMLDTFSGNAQRNSIVILTTRPDNMNKLTKHCHSHIQLKGFTPEHKHEYITKFFKEESDKAELLIDKKTLKKYSHVFEMGRTPLFLFYLCTFWKISKTLPSTVIELFRELMVCKVNQSVGKKYGEKYQSRKVRCFDDIEPGFRKAMLFIGEAVLIALFENRLHVYEDDLNNEHLTRDSIKYGLITEETSQSELSYKRNFSTIHKSESEFLAGFYIADAIRNGENMKDRIKGMLENTRMLQVCKFTVALLKEQARLFLDYFPINDLDCSFLAELLEECPESEESIVIESINSKMIEVEKIKISNPIGLNVCNKLSNFTQTRELNLTTNFINFDGKDVVSILQNMPLLKKIDWQGVNDEYMKTFVIPSPFPFNLETIIMEGTVKHPDACRNLASFLYHCKSLSVLTLPMIAYGPGLYLFVSLLYGHEQCYKAVPGDSHLERATYRRMEHIAFSLKNTYGHEHRVISYVFLFSRFIALCPFLKQIYIFKPDKLHFGNKLFIELTELCVFREYTTGHRSLPDSSDTIEGVLQTPTKNLKFMVTVGFSGLSGARMKINIDVEEIQSTSAIDCKSLQWFSVPFQKIPKGIFACGLTKPSSVLHISWHKDLPFKSEPGEVGKFVSSLCKMTDVISLTLPCEALSSGIFSKETKDLHVGKLKFSLNELTADELGHQSYVTEIADILPHFSTISIIALPPLHNAFTLPSVSNVVLRALNELRQLEISMPDPDINHQTCELLTNVIRQIPTPWFNQMDFNGDGSLIFSLPTMRVYEKYVVRQPRDKRQTSIDVVTFGLGVNLYGYKSCHIRCLVNLLQRVDGGLLSELRKVFIHPSIMFTNPFAIKFMSAFKQIQMIKLNALAENVEIDSKTQILRRIKSMNINSKSVNGWVEMSRNEFIEAVKESQATKDPLADWISLIPLLGELGSDVHVHVSCFKSNLKSLQTKIGNMESLVKLLKDCSSLREIKFKQIVASSAEFQEMLTHCKTHNVVVHTLDSIQFEYLKSIDSRSLRQLLDVFPSISKMVFLNVSLIKTERNRPDVMESTLQANVICPQVSTDSLTELVLSGNQVNGSAIAELLFSFPHLRSVDVSQGVFDESCFMDLLHDVTDNKEYVHGNLETLKLGDFRVTDRKSTKVGKMYGQFLLQMPHLTRIDISRFKMGSSFLRPFLDYFNQGENLHTGLKHLDVSGHRLESEAMISFLDFLKRLPELNVLSMAMCRIYSHAEQLFDHMKEKRLRMLDFSGSYFSSQEQKILFVSDILCFATNEQELYLKKSSWSFLDGLARELRLHNIEPKLRCLNLSHSRLIDFAKIGNLVICFRHLKVLIMDNCQFTGNALQIFTVCIKRGDIVPELLELDISSSDFSAPRSGASIVSVMNTFPKLEVLRLKSCKISNTVVDNMLKKLEDLTSLDLTVTNLRSLVICNNPLSRPLAYAISIGKYLPVSCKVKVTSDSDRPRDEDISDHKSDPQIEMRASSWSTSTFRKLWVATQRWVAKICWWVAKICWWVARLWQKSPKNKLD